MRIQFKNGKLNFVITDVRDFVSSNYAIAGIDYVL